MVRQMSHSSEKFNSEPLSRHEKIVHYEEARKAFPVFQKFRSVFTKNGWIQWQVNITVLDRRIFCKNRRLKSSITMIA